MTLIEHIELDSDTTPTFSSIPQDYTDLLLLVSDRSDRAATNDAIIMKLNGTTSTGRRLFGSGTTVTSTASPDPLDAANTDASGIYSNIQFYIANYASTTQYKSWSADGVEESNATGAYQSITAGLYSSNSAVTSITLEPETGTNFKAGSSFTLLGITAGSDGTTTVS
jgi:hypothetical protein